jgi:hypothetical protein
MVMWVFSEEERMGNRVLVIANAALSMSDSNGRTMAMLFSKYKPEQLAQFYTYGKPDQSVCCSYYHVSDGEALQSFIKRRAFGGKPQFYENKQESDITSSRKRKRTPLNMLLREFVWKYGKWRSKDFFDWIDTFNPTVIFVNLADNIFLIDLALNLSQRYQLPIVVFSTEEYPFKNYNYLTKKPSLLYWLFYWKLNGAYKKLGKYVSRGYFNSPMLRDEYAKRYPYPCDVIMNGSQIDWQEKAIIPEKVKVSYLGNLGLNRHLPLIEVANAVVAVLPDTKLDIYGKIPNETVKAAFENCPNIDYKGVVSYENVTRVIHESTLVVHAETQEPFYVRDLRYGFSTKIADSVCSGTPLLIYGDKSMASMDFIEKENCAFLCTDKLRLEKVVRDALTDMSARKSVLENALRVKEKYFSGSYLNLLDK